MNGHSEQDVQSCRKTDIATELHLFSEAHIRSFNFFLEDGLDLICKHLSPVDIFASQIRKTQRFGGEAIQVPFDTMRIWIEDLVIGMPTKFDNISRSDNRVFPWEARISHGSYTAPLQAALCRVGIINNRYLTMDR
jgi:hypothetical protein